MRSASFSIRSAVIGDYEQLCTVWEVGDAIHRQALPHIFRASGEPSKDPAEVAKLIAGPDSAIFVATLGSEVIGLVTVLDKVVPAGPIKMERRYVEVDNMAVKPSAQRKGIGRALIQAAAYWASQRGIIALELNVFEFNETAAAFYRAAGFSMLYRRMRRQIS
jgi:GNAT superfamily N-acetyltransferase